MSDNKVTYRIDVSGNAIEQYRKLNKEQDKFNKSIGGKTGGGKPFGGISIGATAATAAIIGLGVAAKKTIDKFAQFEKAQAILSNTFGSSKVATSELNRLEEFASNTPFQLDKLTASYVKLVNRGFKPTNSQLTALGDIASSTGKDFDQLAEALLDAETGEFERLKEFGIKAAKNGDKVSFTFKGVTETVQNSSKAIKDYIVGLGKLNGIKGSMAKISKTIEGQESNLLDTWDKTQRLIGQKLAPGYKGLLGFTADLLDTTNALLGASPEDMLYQQANAVQSLTSEYMAGNTTEERRLAILEELKAINPSIVAGVTDHASAVKLLQKNTDSYINSLFTQMQIANLTEEQQEAMVKGAEARQALFDKMNENIQNRGMLDNEMGRTRAANAQKFLIESLQAEDPLEYWKKNVAGRASSYQTGGALAGIGDVIKKYTDILKKSKKETKNYQTTIDALRESMGMGMDEVDAGGVTSATGNAAGTGTKATSIESLQNTAPKTFNVSIGNLVQIDEQNNMTDDDVDAFQQRIADALLMAISSISAQASTF